MIIYTVFKNAVNKEALNYMMLLKKQLGISVNSNIALFLAVVIKMVTAFILAFLIYSIPTQLRYAVLAIVIVFNLFLPSTISRHINQAHEINPIYEAIFLATKNKIISYRALEKSDLILFWFDNIEFPIITLVLFIFEFQWGGLFLTIILTWIMSYIFVRTYRKNTFLKDSSSLRKQNFFPKFFYFLVVGGASLIFIKVFQNITIRDLTNVSETSFFLKNLMNVTKSSVEYFYLHITDCIIFIVLFLTIILFVGSLYNRIYHLYFKKLINHVVNVNCRLNIFLIRDVSRFDNISSLLHINLYELPQLVVPILGFIGANLYLNANINIFFGIDVFVWYGFISYEKYLFQENPILRLGSELQNIELLNVKRINSLIHSKYQLMCIFTFPLLIFVTIIKLSIGFFSDINFIKVVFSTIVLIFLLLSTMVLIIKPDSVSSRFNYDSEFELLKHDLGVKTINLFWKIPIRVISFTISLFFVLFVITKQRGMILEDEYILIQIFIMLAIASSVRLGWKNDTV